MFVQHRNKPADGQKTRDLGRTWERQHQTHTEIRKITKTLNRNDMVGNTKGQCRHTHVKYLTKHDIHMLKYAILQLLSRWQQNTFERLVFVCLSNAVSLVISKINPATNHLMDCGQQKCLWLSGVAVGMVYICLKVDPPLWCRLK